VIGIIASDRQARAVEEFFELFKTPWEFHRPGTAYDVVVCTTADVPAVDARLLVVSGAARTSLDAREGLVEHRRWHGDGILEHRGHRVPVYGDLLTFAPRDGTTPCVVAAAGGVAGVRVRTTGGTVVRLGYDLFDELARLFRDGQPVAHAGTPTLDIHVATLRDLILAEGIGLVEIPATPAGWSLIACLTHDIDFASLRQHRLDHTMWGFLYRATVGATRRFVRGRLTRSQLFQSWRAAASLPFVHLGWARDFWEPFAWYLAVERGLPSTYFLIPFKGRAGDRVDARHAARRAAAYDLSDLAPSTPKLRDAGCELGVHGIDAWHDAGMGRDERRRLSDLTGEPTIGIRMHWLLRDEHTVRALEAAGYDYDASLGYNETLGYRSGTAQVFKPLEAQALLEIPLHIQDGALFFPHNLDLGADEAWTRCAAHLEHARTAGGVVTVLWHDRSHAPERFWGGFYVRLVEALRGCQAWFGTASQVVAWFRQRREIRFERGLLRYEGDEIWPAVTIRIHHAGTAVDIPWNGHTALEAGDLPRSMRQHAEAGSWRR